VISSVFQPAQSASLPNITSPRELLTANALMAASWSVMLAIGAAAGGVATSLFGARAVFAVDALSYLVSAYFIFRTVIPQDTAGRATGPILRVAHREMVEGWNYLRSHGGVARISFAKATWAIGGGALVYMLAIAGQKIDPAAADVAIGILFAARGIGTGIGPVIVRRYFSDRRRWPLVLGGCIMFSGAGYLLFGLLPWSYLLAGLVVAAHASSGANWVLATVLLQERTVDRYRGRVFATEWLLVMGADTVSILAASAILEWQLLSLRATMALFALVMVVTGAIWLRIVVPRERSSADAST
ncbi:MAG: MFS transporter, partial [Rhodothermales bacterium]|nr:MFS transporter [Rhodothermales bacterium]